MMTNNRTACQLLDGLAQDFLTQIMTPEHSLFGCCKLYIPLVGEHVETHAKRYSPPHSNAV